MSETPHRENARGRLALLLACVSALVLAPAADGATLTVEIESSGGATGTVSDGTGAIDCGGPPSSGSCNASFSEVVAQPMLTASPGPSSVFAGWAEGGGEVGIPEDNCYGLVNPCMVWLSADRTVTATFAPAGSQECEAEGPVEEPELGRYIVVLYDWVEDPGAVGRAHVEKYGGVLGFVYRYALKGYSAGFPPAAIPALESEPEVRYVEVDQPVELFGSSLTGEGGPSDEQGCGPGPHEGEPEPGPAPGSDPPASGGAEEQSAAGGPSAGVTASDAGSDAEGIAAPPGAAVGQCRKGTVQRAGRCLRRRSLAVEVCRRRQGTVQLRCRLHSARKPGGR